MPELPESKLSDSPDVEHQRVRLLREFGEYLRASALWWIAAILIALIGLGVLIYLTGSDGGTTGPEFIAFLKQRAGKKLPAAVTAAIEDWWNGYGAIRLYDELTLIECGDDVLLTELLAATSLRASLIHTFSPRLIAIESARTDELVAELTARGYAPRVIEEV